MFNNKRKTRSQSRNNTERLRVEPGVDYINGLNDDCLAEIFTYLSIEDRLRVTAVCKRWREKSELVWHDMRTLNFESKKIPKYLNTNEAIGFILKESGNHLRQLTFGKRRSRSAILPLIAEHCPDLKWLQIPLEGSTCIESWALLTELEYLSVTGMESHFSQNFFDTLACRNLMNLTLLSTGLSFDSPTPARVSPTIFEKLPNLSVLSLRSFHLPEDVLMPIFCNPNLVSLSLSGCFLTGKFPSLNVINLEHLEIGSMDAITDSFLSQVSKICKNLKYLKLGIRKVTDAGLFELRKLSKLEELHIVYNENITDEAFSRMHTLKRLSCRVCRRVRDDGIITLMKYAPNLQFLNLEYSGVTKRVLIEASKIVKKRSNDLELKIIVDDRVKSQWEPEDVPPLLVVKTGEGVIMS